MASHPAPEPSYAQHPSDLQTVFQYAAPPNTNPNRAPLPPGFFPNTDPALQIIPQGQTNTTPQANGDHKTANRLRKACDSCSIRKVKCDETGPPCRACVALEIPCTFDRPSKRRGPPNRLAESIKKHRVESPGGTSHSIPSSPTHAAHTLASFAQQPVFSAESICPTPILRLLVDDYFTFIHPLVPVPHEPSFRRALENRQDLSSSTFLALMASMVGCLTASYPRRVRHHLRMQGFEHICPNSLSFIERCQRVAIEAHGPATFNRPYTVHDVIISYIQGLTYQYLSQRQPAMLYIKESLSIATTLSLHRVQIHSPESNGVTAPNLGQNGYQLNAIDPVERELNKRVFWLLFASTRSLQQMGVSPFELSIPPETRVDPYPPLPLEIDDSYLGSTNSSQELDGQTSELVGFNTNVKFHLTHNVVSSDDLMHGTNEVYDWERQKQMLEKCLNDVEYLLNRLPVHLALPRGPSQTDAPSEHQSGINGLNSVDQVMVSIATLEDRTKIQRAIQQANIFVSQLATRTYLVERYFNLAEARSRQVDPNASIPTELVDPTYDGNPFPATTAALEAHTAITNSLFSMLSTIQQASIESNGPALSSKIRMIVHTLAPFPRYRTSSETQGKQDRVQACIRLSRLLDKTVGANALGSQEDEEGKLGAWADFREEQARVFEADEARKSRDS